MLYFTGDVVGMNPHFDNNLGWVITYTCAGMRNRLDWIPHTDDATGLDISAFNLTLSDPNVNLARSGRTVGQILNQVLTMQGLPGSPEDVGNVASISAYGMGNYFGSPPQLPAVTTNDLAALTLIPPRPVYFGGEKLGDAIDSLLSQWAPNYRWWVDPSGNLRFFDLRAFSANTLVMGTDPIEPAELARDVSRCFQRVLIRGQPTAVMALLKLSAGDLVEDFGHDGLTSTQAKDPANWTPAKFAQPTYASNPTAAQALSSGTVTCTSTTTVNYKSSSPAETWGAGYWDQVHHQGTINLGASILGGPGGSYTQFWSARIVSDSGMVAGSTATFTLDNPLPNTNYDSATITGLGTGASVVWTQYDIKNQSLWPRLTNQSTYPQAFVNASGTGATVLSSPMGLIFRTDGSTFPLAYTFNTITGKIRFIAPTYIIANNAPPTDVWIYQPVNTNALYAVWPHDTLPPNQKPQYGGTSGPMVSGTNPHGVDGLQKTLTVTIDQWTDPGQFGAVALPDTGPFDTGSPSTFATVPTGMNLYAYDLWTSVADAVVEGEVTYYGFPPDHAPNVPALTFGNALTITGKDGFAPSYTTGWELLSLPIREVQVEWPQLSGQDYITRMRVSNRRDVYSADQFLKPPRRAGYSFGMLEGVANVFGGDVPTTEGAQAGIHRYESGFAEIQMPDFASQMVAGQDFGAGIQIPQSRTTGERISGARSESDREAVQRAFKQWTAPAMRGNMAGPSEPGSPLPADLTQEP